MSDEPTGRDVELTAMERGDLAAAYGWWRTHGDPEAFYDTLDAAVERILAERIAQARREGAAEAWDEGAEAVRQYDYHQPPVQNPYRAALRGDA